MKLPQDCHKGFVKPEFLNSITLGHYCGFLSQPIRICCTWPDKIQEMVFYEAVTVHLENSNSCFAATESLAYYTCTCMYKCNLCQGKCQIMMTR